jgi:hypothetical protein
VTCAAGAALRANTSGISWPREVNFNIASCTPSLNVKVSDLGAALSCASAAGDVPLSFACARTEDVEITQAAVNASNACLTMFSPERTAFRTPSVAENCVLRVYY